MILGAIGAIAGIGSTIYGAVKQSQAAKKEEALMAKQAAANEAWYNRNYYQDYLNTVGAQNAIKRYRDLLAEQTKEARARQVITGGTPEQAQAVAEAIDISLGHVYRLQKKGVRRIRGMLSRFIHDFNKS